MWKDVVGVDNRLMWYLPDFVVVLKGVKSEI